MHRAARGMMAAVLASLALAPAAIAAPPARLVGRSVLPADTVTVGPTAGQALGDKPINGRRPPFEDRQPVQGFSGVVDQGDGTFWLLGDNGYGALENSDDALLRLYRVRPQWKGASGRGPGGMALLGTVTLRDPDRKLAWPIRNQFTTDRLLTGADLDPESFQRAPDGTWWIGDEFGPFLVHVDASGKVLDTPVPLPDPDRPGTFIRTPQNPLNEETAPLRIMNALRAHARAHGATRLPVFSPDYQLLDDGDPNTVAPVRRAPGMPSSEVWSVKSLQAAGHKVVPWTCNDYDQMLALMKLGVNGLISDRPDLLRKAVEQFDANGDGKPGDYLDAEGLIDIARFDAQGHRGGRNLRPESTFPAFEVGLDSLMATLETDCVITQDGFPVLSHEPRLSGSVARRLDGKPAEVPIRQLTLRQIQHEYVLDRLQPARTQQTRDLALSPVAVAYARDHGLVSPYVMPSLHQLFQFVRYYERYYRTGPGKRHPDATRRWRNAARVHVDLETKTGPAAEKAGLTPGVDTFVAAVADELRLSQAADRTQIQSFDYRTLLAVQAKHPRLQTVFLLGEDKPLAVRTASEPAPVDPGPGNYWLHDVVWPYRQTARENPFRAKPSGGFEAMAISPDGKTLYPMLEKPLVDGTPGELLVFAFDIPSGRYTGLAARYQLEPGSTSVPDFVLTGPTTGFVIERDDKQGDLSAFKRIFRVHWDQPGDRMVKTEVADLMRLDDPLGLSGPGKPGDVGLGPVFALPFVTIEGLVSLGSHRLGVVTDNNYPFSVGRHVGSKQPDDSEFVVIEAEGI